jgi:ABC-type branched-subunit amino acid transport system substrate-binding protein
MKKYLFVIAYCFIAVVSFAQPSSKIYRVGLFVNLYLDSSFVGDKYKFDKQMPRHILPGIDFSEGALMAIDSLTNGSQLHITVFDIRSATQSITQLKTNQSFDSLDLMIGAVAGAEYRQLADIAFQKNIPFVSATFPNDGGVTNNPFTIIVNSTLPVHCESLYNFVLRNFATANIIYLRKKGIQEDRLASYFEKSNKGATNNSLLKWKVLNADSITAKTFISSLDSERVNVIIAGSLDERFAVQLMNAAAPLQKKFDLQIIGMPTWETLKEITTPEWKTIPMYYSTSFFNNNSAKWVNFTKTFSDSTYGRPSDLAFKAFDLTYIFCNLLLKHGSELKNNFNDKSFRWFLDYDFKPVLNKTSGKPDYFENKRIYILKRTNGLISRMN